MTRVHLRRLQRAGYYLAVLLVLGAYLFPFYWMVLSSLKTHIQNFAFPPRTGPAMLRAWISWRRHGT